MLFNGINTIYNIKLQNAKAIGVPYRVLDNTTLNEKFGIEVVKTMDVLPEYPVVNLLTIGVAADDTATSRLNLTRSKHRPIDAALFNHLPFYLRPVSEVTNTPPSAKARLRKNIIIDGIEYLACYGYDLSGIDYKDDILIYSSLKEEYTNVSRLNTNDATFLNPTPVVTTGIDIANEENEYVTDFLKVEVFLTIDEVLEIKHAMDVLYGSSILITELGICNSIIDVSEDGSEECYAAQIAYFLDTNISIDDAITNEHLRFHIDLGGMDILTV